MGSGVCPPPAQSVFEETRERPDGHPAWGHGLLLQEVVSPATSPVTEVPESLHVTVSAAVTQGRAQGASEVGRGLRMSTCPPGQARQVGAFCEVGVSPGSPPRAIGRIKCDL